MPTARRGKLDGLIVAQHPIHHDERGFFFEAFRQSAWKVLGVETPFVQLNFSCSLRGVLRGLHIQVGESAQGKLVSVVRGAIWDVAVDLRPHSATWGCWEAFELSAENRTQVYLPPGLAHGFLTLSESSDVVYQCTAEYDPEAERGVLWNDPDLAIAWPLGGAAPLISAKDAKLPLCRDWQERPS